MGVRRYQVEEPRRVRKGNRVVKRFPYTEKGKQYAFIKRNKRRRKGRDAIIRVVELNRRGRVIKRYTIQRAENPIEYPFDGSPKDSPKRRAVYDKAVAFKLDWTVGDRTPYHNRRVGGVSNSLHLTTRTDVWADDYGSWSRRRMAAFRDFLNRNRGHYGIVELPPINHGTGPHVHVGGRR